MRLATPTEREQVISRTKPTKVFMAPSCTPKGKNFRLFDDPGYIIKFDSPIWRESTLVLSECIDFSNVKHNVRLPQYPLCSPAKDDFWRRFPRRNMMVLLRNRVTFKARDCCPITPAVGEDEWPAIYAIKLSRRGAVFLEITPKRCREVGKLILPGSHWGNAPSLLITGNSIVNNSGLPSFNMSLSFLWHVSKPESKSH